MSNLDSILQDLDDTSARIGEITRTISLSVLALVWLFIAGGNGSPVLPVKPSSGLLLLSGLLALLSLLSDYFQYVAGYANTKDVLSVAEAADDAEKVLYNDKSVLYRLRTFFFWTKQALVIGALIVLFIAIGAAYCARIIP